MELGHVVDYQRLVLLGKTRNSSAQPSGADD
jgi:hypothetical protein